MAKTAKEEATRAGSDKEYSDAVIGPLEGCTGTMGAERDKVGWSTRKCRIFDDGDFRDYKGEGYQTVDMEWGDQKYAEKCKVSLSSQSSASSLAGSPAFFSSIESSFQSRF